MCIDNGIARGYSVLLAGLSTCPPYLQVESKLTPDFAAQCSLFTYILSCFGGHVVYFVVWL